MSAAKANPKAGVIDAYKGLPGYIEATDWAVPYYASYLQENRIGGQDMFSHVNCSYLSTPGRPPTLVALKQHAQSLAHLISSIAPSQGAGEINNANSGDPTARRFVDGEAFDWLNNLEEAYHCDDPNHHRPLNSLMNIATVNSDTKGVEFMCPLEKAESKNSVRAEDVRARVDKPSTRELAYQKERQVSPWMRHWNLLRHANDCLEILDHEFSSTGGLLSILPTEHELEAEQLDLAKNTLLGQWILHHQALITRMHDLEIDYANSLDTIAGEAIIPMQNLSYQGPDGRSGRELVFPQDRWVLANAGEDVSDFIHQVLDKKQLSEEKRGKWFEEAAVTGGRLTETATDTERGLVSVDLNTRFYRIKGSASDRGPLFVLPAFSDRPETRYTRLMEDRPTVVSVMNPKSLDSINSVTSLEEKYQRKMAKTPTRDHEEIVQLKAQVTELQNEAAALKRTAEYEATRTENILESNKPDADRLKIMEGLQNQLKESQMAERKKQKQADDFEELYNSLLANGYLQTGAKGIIPRDVDGHVTEKALNALLASLKTATATNERLKSTIGDLQQKARARNGSSNAAEGSGVTAPA